MTTLLWPEPLRSHQNRLLEPAPRAPAKFYQQHGCRSQREQRYTVCFHSSALNIINSDDSCIRASYPAPGSGTNCDGGGGKVSSSFRLDVCKQWQRRSRLISTATMQKSIRVFKRYHIIFSIYVKWKVRDCFDGVVALKSDFVNTKLDWKCSTAGGRNGCGAI